MNSNSSSSRTNSPFTQWFKGWRVVGVTTLIVSSGAFLLVTQHQGDVDSIRLVIRLTARVSLAFFCLAFSAAAANRIWPNAWTRWQVANRRYLGLSFAVSHFIHAIAITIFVAYYPRQFHEVHPGSNVPGGIGYFFLLAMVVTSFDRTAALLGTRVWRALHTTGAYVLWTIFLLSESSRLRADHVHLWFIAPLLLAGIIRVLGWRRKAQGQRLNPPMSPTPAVVGVALISPRALE
jgi:methionine sulfoxide reductase heme-binding subunit